MSFRFVTATRQNHALEHATINLLAGRTETKVRLMGRATTGGFYIYGNLPTKMVEEAAKESLARLQEGESELAISPLCGTNLVIGGMLAGVSSLLALGHKDRLRRLPRVILAALMATIAAQPIGRLAQKHLTTSSDLDNICVTRVIRKGKGRHTFHKVETAHR